MSNKRILSLILLLCTVFSILPVGAIGVWAEELGVEQKEDAMEKIEASFSDYKIGDTVSLSDDGYIGIPVELSIYFDKANHTVTSGYGGTPIIVYVVNTCAERVGTDSDDKIIRSMLDRGYVVTVLDYKNDKKAVSPALDQSVQIIRNRVKSKTYFTDSIFPAGTYYDNYVVPAGCDVSLYNVFWEADKHGADGTLDKIVEIWNADFKSVEGEQIVKWVRPDGTRKKTEKAADGSSPIWCNENGTADSDGEYTKVKYTVAEVITDCVNPDGTFIDMNLYIHIVYPTNPQKPVPVMSLANSSGHAAISVQSPDRYHMNGFVFNGYAGVVFDYLWVPMARNTSFGYFDGANQNGSLTGDSLTYSVHVYNDKLVNTAAMRYLRYLALSEGDVYNFDINAFGVYGNSKGGYMTFLGEDAIRRPLADGEYGDLTEREKAIDLALSKFTPHRYLDKHHGETRYQIGDTETVTDTESGFTIHGGELQPWLTYGGEEIISGAQFTYASNGGDSESFTAGHSPSIVAVHMYDTYNNAYGECNRLANMCRTLNVPSVIFEVPLGHTLALGEDLDYGIDTYNAIFSFIGYYLKHDAVSVLYTTPLDRAAGVNVTDKITVKFAGEVSAEEIEKVTVSGDGDVLSGVWTSEFGDTEWTFTPDSMKGGVKYTVTVPAEMKGKNGVAMGEAYTSSFITEYDNASAAVTTVTSEKGSYFSFIAPSAMSMGANGYSIRFRVANNAANIAELYAVEADSYDPSAPDSATVGELVGKINLRGSGSYEIDVTDYVAERAGEKVVLLLKAQKAAGSTDILYINYSSGAGNVSKGSYITTGIDTETFDGNAVYKAVVNNNAGRYKAGHVFYPGVTTAFTLKGLLPSKITAEDYGRQFVFSVRIYDTVSRTIQFRYDTNTNRTGYETLDYDLTIVNVRTKANEWITLELPYTVYDTDYGKVGERQKDMLFRIGSTGDSEMPIYFDDVTFTETVTDVEFGGIVLAEKNDGGIPYKAPESEAHFALYNGDTIVGEYNGWKEALSAYKNGYTLKLRSDYTITDAELYSDFGMDATEFDIDLNGYTITSANTKGSLLWLKTVSASAERTVIRIYGGAILLGRTALISYENSSATDTVKAYGIDLNGVYISTVKGANLTQAISTDTAVSGCAASVSVKLTECTLDFPDDKHAYDEIELLPAGVESLDISYRLDGGSIRLSAQKFVTVQNNANVSEFVNETSGEYTVLVLPASKKANGSSYLRKDGYAIYAASGEADENGFVTYKLSKSENSTRYGVIDEAYTDAEKYPWAVFSGGIFRGAYEELIDASDAVTTLVEGVANVGKESQILLRRDYTNAASGDGFTGLNVIGGTVIIDLGGYTFTRNGSFLDFKSNTTVAPYDNTAIIRNGEIRTMKAAPCDFQYTENQVVDKNFDITFEGVTFGLADTCKSGTSMDLIWVVWDNDRDNIACNASVVLNDCIIDLDTNSEVFEGYTSVTLFNVYDKHDRVNVDITVNGGRIIAPDMSHVTFIKKNSGSDSLTMGRGSDGKFMTATLTGDGTVLGDNFVTTDGENRVFTKISGSETEYELAENELVTKYGVIPLDYGDAEQYPFVLFFDGEFVGAYNMWCNSSSDKPDVIDAAKNLISGKSGAGKIAYILMRRDYRATDSDVYYNLSHVGGTMHVDLGGNTFYVGKNDMFYAEGKLTNNAVHDSTFVVKNGSICTTGVGSTVEMRHAAAITSSHKKRFRFTFEGVTFGLAEGSSTAQPLLYSVNGKGSKCYFNIDLNDCIFDYATVKPSSGITLFHLASSTDTNYVTLNVNGGTFKLDSYENITFSKKSSNDTVTFAKGGDGKYSTVQTLSSTAPDKTVFGTAEGNAVFIEESDNGTKSVYRLTPVPYTDETLSSYSDDFFSGVEYPFAVFTNGKLAENGLQKYLGLAVKLAREITASGTSSVQIMLRADHVTDHSSDKVDSYLKLVNGTLTLDLGGHELTRGAQYILNLGVGNNCLFKTTVIIKNGTIHNTRYVIGISNNGSTAGAKEYDITFENVVIDYKSVEERAVGSLFIAWQGKTGAGAEIALNFNNCTLDLRGAPVDQPIFACDDDSVNAPVNVDVTISGGEIFVLDLSKIVILKGDSAKGDSLSFAPFGESGYTTLTQSSDAPFPEGVFNSTEDCTVSFGMLKAVGANTVYALGEDIKTEYGYLPNRYSDTLLYPFAVFADGEFVGACSKWGDSGDAKISALSAVKKAIQGVTSAGKTAYILMRRNYTVTSDDLYYNLSQVGGTLVLDMNGFVMTTEYEVFSATAKATSNVVHTSEYVIKNGSFTVKTAPIIRFSDVNTENYKQKKTMIFRFENVTFELASGYTSDSLICTTKNVGNVGLNAELTFSDCAFDLSGLGKTQVTLIDLKDNRNVISGKVTFIGGRIISDSANGWSISKLNKGSDTVVFDADSNGNYMTFAYAPSYDFRNSDGEMLTVSEVDGGYTLVPHTHSYEATVTAPTCTEGGYTTYTCSACGDTYVDTYVPATGIHTYDNDFDADCNVCGEVREVATTEGMLNAKISWSYADGVLTISGNGRMPVFNYGEAPWSAIMDKITAVVIEEGVTSIGRTSFHSATALTSVTLPEGLKRIDDYAFYGCTALKTVTVPASVTEIGAYAFRKSGVDNVEFAIAYGWSSADSAFASAMVSSDGAAMLKSFYKTKWVRDVKAEPDVIDPNYVDSGICGNGLKWTLTYIDPVKKTMKLTVSGTGKMTEFGTAGAPWYEYAWDIVEVEVESGVTSIGRCAFFFLRRLTKVTIADTVTVIGDYAFNTCWSLKEITLPEGVTKIGTDAFKKTGLAEIPTV